MRRLEVFPVRALSTLMLLVAAVPSTVRGQAAPCTYARCGLRIDQGFFRTRIVAGEDGRPVAKVGGFGTDLERRVQLPDSALAHTQKYNSLSKLSTGLLVAGAAAIFLPVFVDRGDAGPRVAVSVAGLGLAIASGAVQAGARNHLNQALWWYNAGFAR